MRRLVTPSSIAFIVLGLASLSGCINPPVDDHPGGGHHGDGDPHHPSDGSAGNLAITGAEDIIINVTAGVPSEMRFTPPRVEVLSGQRVGINFTNNGDLEHEFSIKGLDFHLHAQAGSRDRGAFIAPEPGEYVIGCYIPGHFEAGMAATLVVG